MSVAYPNISASGTREVITCDPPHISIDWMRDRAGYFVPGAIVDR
jgi:hypothetical protein